ncbi:MAG: hypothetical protein IE929_04350 [Rhizorhabdus sp.]|nr:hypothetical protein [Rhizorhabdus sp.]
MVVMHFDQFAHEGKARQASGHPIADDVADFECRRIEVEFEWAAPIRHILHDRVSLRPPYRDPVKVINLRRLLSKVKVPL